MQKSIYLFLFILIASMPAFSQSSTQNFTTNEGDQFQIELRPDKDTIMLGETTFISFQITNLTAKDANTGLGFYADFSGTYEPSVVGENGKLVMQPRFGRVNDFGSVEKVPANGSYVTKLFLPHLAKFEETGIYKINIKKTVTITNRTTQKSTPFVTEFTTIIKIIPIDNDKLGELIDSLGNKMLDSNNPEFVSAAKLFAFIQDERTIKYHAQVLEKFREDLEDFSTNKTFLKCLSIGSLRKYNDDAALEALKNSIVVPDQMVRKSIAEALFDSPHPKALKLLLEMRNDKDSQIRLIVVLGLGKIESDESTALLREMLKDESERVRIEAKIYLDRRGQK